MASLTKRNGRYIVPGSNSAILTETKKMPCRSFSLPAGQSCPAMVIGPNAICDKCYALDRGSYAWRTTKHAQAARFNWVTTCMRSAAGREEFITSMVTAIGTRRPIFRVHDSGDLFSPVYADCWAEIARRLPSVTFWIPTRTYRFMALPKWARALTALSSLPNVTLRPSALHFNDAPPTIPGFAAGTSASTTGAHTCPAHEHGNQCGPCRACFTSPSLPVIYRAH